MYLPREKILDFPAAPILCRLSPGNDKHLPVAFIPGDIPDFFFVDAIDNMSVRKGLAEGLLRNIRPAPFRLPHHQHGFHFVRRYIQLQRSIPGNSGFLLRFGTGLFIRRQFSSAASGIQLSLLFQLRFIPILHGFNQSLLLGQDAGSVLGMTASMALPFGILFRIQLIVFFFFLTLIGTEGRILCICPFIPKVFHEQIIKQTFFLHGDSPLPVDVPVYPPLLCFLSQIIDDFFDLVSGGHNPPVQLEWASMTFTISEESSVPDSSSAPDTIRFPVV